MRPPTGIKSCLGFAACALVALTAANADADRTAVHIPFAKFSLANGLTVIFHEDHTLPLVAVNTMVRVGSRFEDAGRTGFAHLFEHLMFMGTARVPTKMFDGWMEAEGGSNNAWTSQSQTDFYDVAPSNVLPLLLWLEADRLGSLGNDMTQEKLDAQRAVVRNERRQTSENRPYGKVELRLPELLYPPDHPYHHPVIGSHEDLEAATLKDVRAFFQRWYVPKNLSLVVAGDFNPLPVRQDLERLFGALPPGNPPPSAANQTTPQLRGVVRDTLVDNVELPKVVMAWHSPARFQPGDAELDLLATALHEGKESRLYRALVYDHALAQEVSAEQSSQDLGSYFAIEALAQPGVSLDVLEGAMDSEVARIASTALSMEELSRAKNQHETAFVLGLASIAERATVLNTYEACVGDPGYVERDLDRYRRVTPESLHQVASNVLKPDARVVLRVVPMGRHP